MSRLRFVSLAAGTFAALAVAFPHGVRAQVAAPPAFRNPDLPLEQRVLDLLSRLSTDEKVSLLIERAAPVERLGIPRFPWWNEALHGVARAGRATVFPQAIGLAASWDAELMHRVASATSDEARAMHNRCAARRQCATSIKASSSGRRTSTSSVTPAGAGDRRPTARTRS